MRLNIYIFRALLALLTLPVITQQTAASNCPPISPLIPSDGSERLIAQVHVVAKIPSPSGRADDALLADVVRSFNTQRVPDRIIIESSYPVLLGSCGISFGGVFAGDVLMVNATINPETGYYGGGSPDNFAVLENGNISGMISGPLIETVGLSTFRELALSSFDQLDNGTHEVLGVLSEPAVITERQAFELKFIGHQLLEPDFVEVDQETNSIQVVQSGRPCFAGGHPPHPPNNSPQIVSIGIDGLPAGTYTLEASFGRDCAGDATSISDQIRVYPAAKTLLYRHESPAPGETVS